VATSRPAALTDADGRVGVTPEARTFSSIGFARQAILHRAFTGRLVAQDPADEPASVLLQRLRAEREAGGSNGARPRGARRRAGREGTQAELELG
jgi:hypothetical protein